MPFIDADQVPLSDDVMNAISRRYHGAKIPEPKYGSPALKKVVLKACEFKAENRYHSARMMYKALEIAERGGNPGTEGGTYSGSSWGASRDRTSFGTNGWQDTNGTIGNNKGKENQYNQKTVGADSSSKQKTPKKEEKTTVEKTVVQAPKEESANSKNILTIFGILWTIIAVAAMGWIISIYGKDEYFAIAGLVGEIIFLIWIYGSKNSKHAVLFLVIKYAADVIAGIMLMCLAYEYEYIKGDAETVLVVLSFASFIWPAYVMKKGINWKA